MVALRGSKCNSTHPQFLTPYPHVSLLDYVVEVGSHGDRKPSASPLGLLFVRIMELIIRLVTDLKTEEEENKTPVLVCAFSAGCVCLWHPAAARRGAIVGRSRSCVSAAQAAPAPAARSIRGEAGGRDHSPVDQERMIGAGGGDGGEEERFLEHTIRGASRGAHAPAAAEGGGGGFSFFNFND